MADLNPGDTHPYIASLFWDGDKWELRKTKGRKAPQLCRTVFCRSLARAEYRKTGDSYRMVYHATCTKCQSRRWRANNPVKTAYKDLRQSARKRGIAFTLSFSRFEELAEESGYCVDRREFNGKSLTIDRIDSRLGYADDNVQVLTCSENVAKGNRERYWRADHPEIDLPAGVFDDAGFEDEPSEDFLTFIGSEGRTEVLDLENCPF